MEMSKEAYQEFDRLTRAYRPIKGFSTGNYRTSLIGILTYRALKRGGNNISAEDMKYAGSVL